MIGVSEVYRSENDSRLSLLGYHDLLTRCREDGTRGGVGLFMKDNINYRVRDDLSVFMPHVFESLFIELVHKANKHTIVGVIYRYNTVSKVDIDVFSSTLHDVMDIINTEHTNGVIMGDMNVGLLNFESHNKTIDYLDNIFTRGFVPMITRVTMSSASLIDHIYTNNLEYSCTSEIITDLADHFCIFHCIRGKSPHTASSYKQTRFLQMQI